MILFNGVASPFSLIWEDMNKIVASTQGEF
jgi:hypothetical protein